jgi:large repetitive protein
VNGRGEGQFTVQNNGSEADPLSGSAGNVIDISAGGNVTVQATVTGNRIDAAGQTANLVSGIAAGVGAFDVSGNVTLGNATLYATIQNNFVDNSHGWGIVVNVNNQTGSNAVGNVIMTNNDVGAPANEYGIAVRQNPPTLGQPQTTVVNLQIEDNTSVGSSGGGITFPGIGLRKEGTASNRFNIVGLTPSPATNAQMETYVSGQNPNSASGTFGTGGTASISGSSNNWTSIVSVPQPTALP